MAIRSDDGEGVGTRAQHREPRVVRNGRGATYRACTAQTLAAARACQPRRPRKLADPWLWQYVQTPLTRAVRPNRLPGGFAARILMT